MTIFYFTATGNSLAVAKQIGGELISIPQVIDSTDLNFKDDAIGIVFPIFWWNPPFMVRHFIDKFTFEADYLFTIGTYGSISGGAMSNLRKLANEKGYSFNYTNQLLMLDNYLPVYEMETQAKKLAKKDVVGNTAKIVSDIYNRKQMEVKANFATKAMTKVVGRRFNPAKNAQKYIVNDKCNNCGICAKVCPSKNITVSSEVIFSNQCEGCLACLHLCPQNALHIKNQRSNKRWRNPDTTLAELIEANNRTGVGD